MKAIRRLTSLIAVGLVVAAVTLVSSRSPQSDGPTLKLRKYALPSISDDKLTEKADVVVDVLVQSRVQEPIGSHAHTVATRSAEQTRLIDGGTQIVEWRGSVVLRLKGTTPDTIQVAVGIIGSGTPVDSLRIGDPLTQINIGSVYRFWLKRDTVWFQGSDHYAYLAAATPTA